MWFIRMSQTLMVAWESEPERMMWGFEGERKDSAVTEGSLRDWRVEIRRSVFLPGMSSDGVCGMLLRRDGPKWASSMKLIRLA